MARHTRLLPAANRQLNGQHERDPLELRLSYGLLVRMALLIGVIFSGQVYASPSMNPVVRLIEAKPYCGANCGVKETCCASAYHLRVKLEIEVKGAMGLSPIVGRQVLKAGVTAWRAKDALNLPITAILSDQVLGEVRRTHHAVGYTQVSSKPLKEFARKSLQTIELDLRLERRISDWFWSAQDCPNAAELVLRVDLIGNSIRGKQHPDRRKDNLAFMSVSPPLQGVARPVCPR